MIGEEAGVSSSTAGNRINQLEDEGLISSYQPTLDYEKAGFDHIYSSQGPSLSPN